MKKHSLTQKQIEAIERGRRDLATNFDTPARDIIARACIEAGITRAQYDRYMDSLFEADARA